MNGDSVPVQSEQDDEQDVVNAIKLYCKEPKAMKEIVEYFKFPNRSYFKWHYLDDLLENDELKMTIPDKPSSKNQKYFSE